MRRPSLEEEEEEKEETEETEQEEEDALMMEGAEENEAMERV